MKNSNVFDIYRHKFKIINLNYLLSSTNDNQFICKMLNIFKEETILFEQKFFDALSNKDYDKLFKLAHKSKSIVAVVGMTKQRDFIELLEKDCREKINVETYEKRILSFVSDCKDAITEVQIVENNLI